MAKRCSWWSWNHPRLPLKLPKKVISPPARTGPPHETNHGQTPTSGALVSWGQGFWHPLNSSGRHARQDGSGAMILWWSRTEPRRESVWWTREKREKKTKKKRKEKGKKREVLRVQFPIGAFSNLFKNSKFNSYLLKIPQWPSLSF